MAPLALILAACTAATASTGPSSSAAGPTSAATGSPATSSASPVGGGPASATPATTAEVASAAPPAGWRWQTFSGDPGVAVARTDHGAVSLMWLDSPVLRFHYVPGRKVPGGPVSPADVRPSSWVDRLVAGFDGGFKLTDHVGGYWYRGTTVAPLRTGLGAFALTSDGALHVGVWGRDLRWSPDLVVVRENLRPLVDHGASVASPSDGPSRWGIANGGRSTANRSALGVRADGTLVFAYGHDVTAYTLAESLVAAGVREAVDLDMNISWPTGFVYLHRGALVHGVRINPAVVRPPSTYLTQFTKDFVAVLRR